MKNFRLTTSLFLTSSTGLIFCLSVSGLSAQEPRPAPPLPSPELLSPQTVDAHETDSVSAAMNRLNRAITADRDVALHIHGLGQALVETLSTDPVSDQYPHAIKKLLDLCQSTDFEIQRQAFRALESVFTKIQPTSIEMDRRYSRISQGLQSLVIDPMRTYRQRRTAFAILVTRASKSIDKDQPELPVDTETLLDELQAISASSSAPHSIRIASSIVIDKLKKRELTANNNAGTDTDTNNDTNNTDDPTDEFAEQLKFQPVAAGDRPTAADDLPTVGHGTGTAADRLGVSVTRPFDPERDAYSPKRKLRGENRKPSTSDAARKARSTGATGAVNATGAYGIEFKPAKLPEKD